MPRRAPEQTGAKRRRVPSLLRILPALLLLLIPLEAAAQFRGGGGGGGNSRRRPEDLWGMPDLRTGFVFCRLMFDAVSQDPSGTGYRIEYPRADQNFPTRLSQLTSASIATWSRAPSYIGWDGMPGHTVVQATDPELFQCPFVMMSSAGTAGFTGDEAAKLREYLLKGGFLWGDDFWGVARWEQFKAELERILPGYPIVQLKPGDPVFSTFYSIQEVPQIPSISAFRRMGYMSTSELGAESATPTMHAIFDEGGRPMVLLTHNTDIADGWEREADLEVFFQRFAWQAYAVGINVLMWVMTR